MDRKEPPDQVGMGEEIQCGCGCAATFRIYDDRKRERAFLPGHYLRYLQRLLAKAKGGKYQR